jgi:hypothetical protein
VFPHQALLAALILDAKVDIILITPLAEFSLATRERITAMLFTMSVLAKLVPLDITRLASSHALKSPLLDAIPQILVLLIALSARQTTSRDSTAQVLSLAALLPAVQPLAIHAMQVSSKLLPAPAQLAFQTVLPALMQPAPPAQLAQQVTST